MPDDGTESRIFLADGLGSTRIEKVGNQIETTTTYEPYGKLLVQSGPSGTVYGYTGEAHGASTGLAFIRARYYGPSAGNFNQTNVGIELSGPGDLISVSAEHSSNSDWSLEASASLAGIDVSELIWVYQDENVAQQAFVEMRSTITSLVPHGLAEYETSGPNPAITSILTRCRPGYDGRFGSYHGCDARMQYDRYLIELSMTVDGQIVTMADWTTMLQLVQDRVVAFVEQES